MKCKICNHENEIFATGKILNKYDVSYYLCSHCNFLQTEEPYWLSEAYAESINDSDTGYMARNLEFSNKLTVLLTVLFGIKESQQFNYLDYAGGYGCFVRLMRDIGFNFYWEDKYTKNLFAQGFEYSNQPIKAITAFEVFEHFINPLEEIEKLLKISDTIIFSTQNYPNDNPKPDDWWYFGLDHGQHISFFSPQVYEYITEKLNLNYYWFDGFHILTKNKIEGYKLKLYKKGLRYDIDKLIKKYALKSKTMDDYSFIINKKNKG